MLTPMMLTESENKLLDAILHLVPDHGFRALSLRTIAKTAGLSLAQAYAACPTKFALINAYGQRLEAEVLAGEDPATSAENQHDLLFDAVMRGFDAMLPNKAAIRRIDQDIRRDPLFALGGVTLLHRGINALILAAGIEWAGLRRIARRARLTGALFRVYQIWLAEDDPGQSRTMAELDRLLRQIDDGQSSHSGAQTN